MRAVVAGVAMLTVGAAAPPTERIVTDEGIVTARIATLPVRLRIEPGAPSMPVIDRHVAERAGLKMAGGLGISIGYAVGPVQVMTRTQVVPVDFGTGRPGKRRVGWASRPFTTAAAASVGPGGVPEPVVRFRLRDPLPGERPVVLREVHQSGPLGMFGNFSAYYAEIDVGGAPMRVRFDPHRPHSLATAGAGVRLTRAFDGRISGDPRPTEIAFGVERPVRTLSLARPLAIGPLRIDMVGVRVSDGGSAAGLREASDVAPDPDEVVVTGKADKRGPRRDTIMLGADHLSRCSSIVFDKPARRITLTCA